MGSGFKEIDFSHEGVKQVVGLFIGFVFAIASAPCDFLYLNQQKYDTKKKEKRKKKKQKNKKSPLFP